MAADVVTMVILLLLSLSFLWVHTLDMSDVDTQLSELRSHVNTLEFASKVYSLIIDTFDCPAPSREDPPGPHCSVLLEPCASNTLVRNSSWDSRPGTKSHSLDEVDRLGCSEVRPRLESWPHSLITKLRTGSYFSSYSLSVLIWRLEIALSDS